ncbi:MAG: N-acetylmuramoyl-L-alanine amidase [bacterium]|nr:N-acetylmuramoyl-L-alanine amidase [bacterium]
MIPTRLILHCSATKDGQVKDWQAIRRFHVEDRGWKDVGYHFGIEEVGGYLMCFRGRPVLEQGAHCRAAGRNRDSLGVCVVGQYDESPPSPFLLSRVCDVAAMLCFTFDILAERVHGHCEFEDAKTCPGSEWDLDQTREFVDLRLRRRIELGPHIEMDQFRF